MTESTGSDSKESCCPPGSHPAVAPPKDYKLKGEDVDLDGHTVYVSGKDGKRTAGIVLFPDIFGLDSGRTKQIVDEFAQEGFVAVLVDVFGKDLFNGDWGKLTDWVKKYPWDKLNSIVGKLTTYLEGLGVKSFGILGFCWGTYAVVKASASGKFAAGVHFHPSHPKIGGIFDEDEKAMITAIKCPQLICAAGNDPASVKPGGLSEEILNKKDFGKENQFVNFPDMQHGWTNRGDISDPKIAKDVQKAVDLATAFFKKHLSSKL